MKSLLITFCLTLGVFVCGFLVGMAAETNFHFVTNYLSYCDGHRE